MTASNALVDVDKKKPREAGSVTSQPLDQIRSGLPLMLIISGAVAPVLFVLWQPVFREVPPFTGGGAAAFAGAALIVGLILQFPAIIMDAAPGDGGEPSTMRVLCLAVVLSFCVVVLRTAWNEGGLPSLEGQGNWVWLVTAALGGKALQKFAEMKEPQAPK